MKEKKNICCVWNSSWLLGGVLTGSWLLLTFRNDFLLVPGWFLFIQESQVCSRIIKKQTRTHQEAAGTPPRCTKTCPEVSKRRRRSVKKFLKIAKKNLGPSRSINNNEEMVRSYEEVSKKPSRLIKNSSSARFLFKFVKVGQLLDGQPEFSRTTCINKNYTRIKRIKGRKKLKWIYFSKQNAGNFISFQLLFLFHPNN